MQFLSASPNNFHENSLQPLTFDSPLSQELPTTHNKGTALYPKVCVVRFAIKRQRITRTRCPFSFWYLHLLPGIYSPTYLWQPLCKHRSQWDMRSCLHTCCSGDVGRPVESICIRYRKQLAQRWQTARLIITPRLHIPARACLRHWSHHFRSIVGVFICITCFNCLGAYYNFCLMAVCTNRRVVWKLCFQNVQSTTAKASLFMTSTSLLCNDQL